MKKILVVAALALVSFANAQKGTVLVAGDVDFSSSKNGDSKENSFSFNPKVGYQFNDNMTVGVEAGIGSTKESVGSVDVKTNNLKVGGFLRYAKSLGGAFAAYADLGAGYQSAEASSVKSNGFYVGITPALFIDFKKSFGLNFSIGGLGYDSLKADVSGAEATNTFGFNFGKTVSIGISKNF